MIEVKNIHKSFGYLEVLKGVNLMVQKGEIVAIVGKSGAGKTTLLQIIGTLDQPTQGEVIINGERLMTNSGVHGAGERVYSGYDSPRERERLQGACRTTADGTGTQGTDEPQAQRTLRRRETARSRSQSTNDEARYHPCGRTDGQPGRKEQKGTERFAAQTAKGIRADHSACDT